VHLEPLPPVPIPLTGADIVPLLVLNRQRCLSPAFPPAFVYTILISVITVVPSGARRPDRFRAVEHGIVRVVHSRYRCSPDTTLPLPRTAVHDVPDLPSDVPTLVPLRWADGGMNVLGVVGEPDHATPSPPPHATRLPTTIVSGFWIWVTVTGTDHHTTG